jgi:hypothetical protein
VSASPVQPHAHGSVIPHAIGHPARGETGDHHADRRKRRPPRRRRRRRLPRGDKALEERIAKTVNAALSSHMKRAKLGLAAEDLEKILEDRDKKKAELAEEERKKKAAGQGADNAPEIAKLKKQIEELTKKATAAEAKSAEQERKQKEADDKATISKTLEAAGVPGGPARARGAEPPASEGLVKRTDEGLVWTGKDGDERSRRGHHRVPEDRGREALPAAERRRRRRRTSPRWWRRWRRERQDDEQATSRAAFAARERHRHVGRGQTPTPKEAPAPGPPAASRRGVTTKGRDTWLQEPSQMSRSH